MERNEEISLKLRMGLSPAVRIDPHELRIMWQQLCAERLHAQRTLNKVAQPRIHATPLSY